MKRLQVIPAINILGGTVVRLRQGDPKVATTYADDPITVAKRFAAIGAKLLYVQDVDSLTTGTLSHLDIAARIAKEVDIATIFGATISAMDVVEQALQAPFESIELRADHIIGTPFLKDVIDYAGDRLRFRLDVRDNSITLDTPDRRGKVTPIEFVKELGDAGAKRLVLSDLNRYGMLGGPNFVMIRTILGATSTPITIAGGIAHPDHIHNLEKLGVQAAIIGKSLYTGDLKLAGHLDDEGCWRD